MAFGRPPLNRRALLAATLGAIYAFLILPAPGTVTGVSVFGVAWFLLSLGLLFLRPLAYHAFSLWAILWIVFRGVAFFRGTLPTIQFALDVALPLTALILLLKSGYLLDAQAADGIMPDEDE